jgi:hypothetical protein
MAGDQWPSEATFVAGLPPDRAVNPRLVMRAGRDRGLTSYRKACFSRVIKGQRLVSHAATTSDRDW